MAQYLLALCLTILVEAGIAFLLGLRTRRGMLAVAAVNTLTHPLLSFTLLALAFLGRDATLGMILLLELLIVAAEWRLLAYALGLANGRAFLISLAMNAASFLTGVLLFWPK
jgi:hypothetical protein